MFLTLLYNRTSEYQLDTAERLYLVRVRVRVRGGLRPELEDTREEDRCADVRAAEL